MILRDLIEVETRAARKEFRVVAVADVDQHVRLDMALGEELRVDLGVVEAGHRAGVEPDGAQREDQIGDLQRAVLERGARRELRIAGEPGPCTSTCGIRNGR